jgi:hypothetical protein
MAEEEKKAKQVLVIQLPEDLAKRLELAATRASRSPTETVLDLLDRNLPRLNAPAKRIPYA